MSKKLWLFVGIGMAVFSVALGAQLLAQDVAPMADPVAKLQKQTVTGFQDFMRGQEIARQVFQIRAEVESQEAQINIEHAVHERAVALWLEIKTYSQSAMDASARGQYQGRLNPVLSSFAEAVSRASQQRAQAVSQAYQEFQQVMSRSIHQNLQGSVQDLNQNMQKFEDKPTDMKLADLMLDPAPDTKLKQEAAHDALNKSLEEARGKLRLALADATKAWKDKLNEITAQAQNGALDLSATEAALRKTNRAWLAAALPVMDELRASFRTAERKYVLQLED